MKIKRRNTRRGRIEIIPMIDTILILLVFYMTFSSFTQKEKRMNVKMPLIGRTIKSLPNETPNLVLHVYDKSKIVVGDGQHDMATLREMMMGLAGIGQEITVVIEAEPDTPYEDVIGALDACATANLKKVAFRPLANSSGSAAAIN
jgi:biopolymer transport protein ExbD